MMNLRDLLQTFQLQSSVPADCEIYGLQNDSRRVKPGDLFLAYPGAAQDGRQYIRQAVERGAVALLYEPCALPAECYLPSEIPCIAFAELAQYLAMLAKRFYMPQSASALAVTGVTGTNGKTTIAYQLTQAYSLLGIRSAYIGTLGQGDVEALQPLNNTTPDALCLHQLFFDYQQRGIQQICMEVSSHALVQQRVAEIDFMQAIFTNLSHEHLDYHQTMEAYAAAKAMLFATPGLKTAIVNQDESFAAEMLAQCEPGCETLTYSLQSMNSDVRAINCNVSLQGNAFDVISPWGKHSIHTRTIGQFNIYNSLAVFASLCAAGYSSNDIVTVMAKLRASPGRMEIIAAEPCVIVDYAHTPDALENVLLTLQQLREHPSSHSQGQSKIWVIFGCGGDRDKRKRPLMGRIAGQYGDVVVVTSDNPRTEDPLQILNEIAVGLDPSHAHVLSIVDRREAIQHVLNCASKQDIILIAGKGHEAYQIIGKTYFDFSDHQVVREYLA